MMVTLAGIVVVLLMVIDMISNLFNNIKAYSALLRSLNMNIEALQIVGLGIIAAVAAIVLKSKSRIGMYISIAAGIVIFMMIIGRLVSTVDILTDIAGRANLDSMHLSVVLKVIGIAYITEFGSQVCKDAGKTL